jgi:hypothetical protein
VDKPRVTVSLVPVPWLAKRIEFWDDDILVNRHLREGQLDPIGRSYRTKLAQRLQRRPEGWHLSTFRLFTGECLKIQHS